MKCLVHSNTEFLQASNSIGRHSLALGPLRGLSTCCAPVEHRTCAMQALLRTSPGTAALARLALQRAFTSLPVIDVMALLEPDQVGRCMFPGV